MSIHMCSAWHPDLPISGGDFFGGAMVAGPGALRRRVEGAGFGALLNMFVRV
jgi:hypothetical protein